MNRADRFLERADKFLANKPAAEAELWLKSQIRAWELQYNVFVATDGTSHPGASAHDFVLTITGLVERLDARRKVRREQLAIRQMSEERRARRQIPTFMLVEEV